MEITANSKYDYDAAKALVYLGMYRKSNPKKVFRSRMIFSAILFLTVIIEMIVFGFDPCFLILLVVVLLLPCLLCFLHFAVPKIQYRSMAKMKELENTFVFRDDSIDIVSKGEQYSGTARIRYSLLVKAAETSQYLFLYQTNSQVFIVDLSTIAGGSPNGIRNKLYSFLGKRYIVCKY